MKKVLVAFAIITVLLCGCKSESDNYVEEKRFIVERTEAHSTFSHISIIRDSETGKAYLFVRSGYGGGLTLLEEN